MVQFVLGYGIRYLQPICITMLNGLYLLTFLYNVRIFCYRRNKLKILVALAVSFSTGLIVFLFIGHITKLTSLWVFPVLFLLLFSFQKRIKLIEIFLLIFFMDAMFLGWHVQIIFYIFFAVMIYFFYFFFRSIRIKISFLQPTPKSRSFCFSSGYWLTNAIW
jgi:hypothetical protein